LVLHDLGITKRGLVGGFNLILLRMFCRGLFLRRTSRILHTLVGLGRRKVVSLLGDGERIEWISVHRYIKEIEQ
jgi:hypothetical protein